MCCNLAGFVLRLFILCTLLDRLVFELYGLIVMASARICVYRGDTLLAYMYSWFALTKCNVILLLATVYLGLKFKQAF